MDEEEEEDYETLFDGFSLWILSRWFSLKL